MFQRFYTWSVSDKLARGRRPEEQKWVTDAHFGKKKKMFLLTNEQIQELIDSIIDAKGSDWNHFGICVFALSAKFNFISIFALKFQSVKHSFEPVGRLRKSFSRSRKGSRKGPGWSPSSPCSFITNGRQHGDHDDDNNALSSFSLSLFPLFQYIKA